MKDLIEALTIFLKYMPDCCYPTHCEHDVMMVGVAQEEISHEDKIRLEELSFQWSNEYDCFISYRFGSY